MLYDWTIIFSLKSGQAFIGLLGSNFVLMSLFAWGYKLHLSPAALSFCLLHNCDWSTDDTVRTKEENVGKTVEKFVLD